MMIVLRLVVDDNKAEHCADGSYFIERKCREVTFEHNY
jgi:hypothetical protein